MSCADTKHDVRLDVLGNFACLECIVANRCTQSAEAEKAKKPSLKERAEKLWAKTQLDVTTMKIMAK